MTAGIVCALGACGVALGQPAQTIGYGDPSDEATPLTRAVDASGVGLEAVHNAIGGAIVRLAFSAHPSADSLAMVTEEADGAVRVRIRTDGAWGVDATVTSDASGGSAAGFAVAHEQSSGRLAIAYRRAGQSNIFYRTHDGSLSGESSVDLGFSSAPDHLALFPRPGADDLLLVASGGDSLRAAVWDGSAFGQVQTLDGLFTGAAASWDACPLPGGAGWMVGWARATDSTLRVRSFSGGAWGLEQTGPSAGGDIGAVALCADPLGAESAAMVQRASNGRIYAARHVGGAWTGATQIDGGASAFDLAYDGVGGSLLGVWAEDDDDRLRYRRWEDDSWSGTTTTGALGDGITKIIAAPINEAGAVALLARLETAAGGAPYGGYVAYSSDGNIELGGWSINGQTGSDEPGVGLPADPGLSAGSNDLSYGNNADVTIAPGAYGDVEVGQNSTLRFGAGNYSFKKFESGNNTHFIADTSGGDVTIVVTHGAFEASNSFRLESQGSGGAVVHIRNGNFEVMNNADIEGVIVVHNGAFEAMNNATVVGHIYAKGNIEGGANGSLTAPGWSPPGAGGVSAQEAWVVLVDGGVASSPIELTDDAWEGSGPLPLAISERVGPGVVRVLRWRETPAFDDE